MLERARYGRRSEKLRLDPSERGAVCLRLRGDRDRARRYQGGARQGAGPRREAQAPRPRKGFAAHLERVEVVIEPEVPPAARAREGPDRRRCLRTARRDPGEVPGDRHPPAEVRLRGAGTASSRPWPRPISSRAALPTEALLAQIAVSKYADGLPLYRQEAIYARDGVDSTAG